MSGTPSMAGHVLLAIESTCDETAAAVLTRDGQVLGDCVATQENLHQRFGGVVPEIAARAHLERIIPVIDTALSKANVTPHQLAAIAVADRPGLAGSLLVGVVAAKTLSIAWRKPLVPINHLHAHLYACVMPMMPESNHPDATSNATTAPLQMANAYPAVGLIVSGGHTSLYHLRGPIDLDYLGGTIDDAAGEAFDKVGSMLGLGFPGGVQVANLAASGDPNAFAFPRSMLNQDDDNFSFSGLKTAARYAITGPGRTDFSSLKIDDVTKANVCASFEAAVVDVLVTKACRAIRRMRVDHLLVGGGVASNQRLRRELTKAADRDQFSVHIAPASLCTDNAVMGAIAWLQLEQNQIAGPDLDITPGLQRGY